MRFAILFILLCSAAAAAQERPLSVPSRPPVPLTSEDQERARKAELERMKSREKKPAISLQLPVARPDAHQHISSRNPIVDQIVREAAARHGLDPCLVLSVMRAESGFNQRAISPKGASGLMQLMPATAERFGVKNIFDPRENIFAGARYLRWLLDRFNGDLRLALAGYNAGEGAVELYGKRIPPFAETQNYVRTIYARYSSIHTVGLKEVAAVEAPRLLSASTAKIPTYNQIIRLTSSTGETGSPDK
jgi:soluble lytic murein transglycosylase-like protein